MDSSSPNWSLGDNWYGDAAPPAGDTSDLLDFPATLNGGDCAGAQTDTCYTAEDDFPNYAVDAITLDDGGTDNYLLQADSDNDALKLGSGGVTATTSSSAAGGAEVGFPIELTAPQTWSIDGGPAGQGQLQLDRGLSAENATSDTLEVELENFGYLTLAGDNEVGAVSVEGSGASAGNNGWLSLDDADLDTGDGQSVDLSDAGIFGTGAVGALTSDGGAVSPGYPTGSLAVDGSAMFANDSVFQPLIGGAPGTDSSELTANGQVSLGSNTDLDIQSTDTDNSCPTLTTGTTYTLISTTGTISGTFADAASNELVSMDCTGSPVPKLWIEFHTTGSPETVTATVAGPAPATAPIWPTTTTLSSNETWTPDAPVTFTATVASPDGAPQGSVTFEAIESPSTAGTIPVPTFWMAGGTRICTAVPVAVSGVSDTATCAFTNPPAGNYLQFAAAFEPSQLPGFMGSFSNVVGDPIEGIPYGTSVGLGLTTNIKGDSLVVTMRCPAGNGCDVNMALAATETLKHGRVVAASASRKTVTVAADTMTLAGGATKTITLPLNAEGKKLLKKLHHLTAKLSVSSNGLSILGANFTFKYHH
jgi:hypothetical protein